jgi:hypothetical protein
LSDSKLTPYGSWFDEFEAVIAVLSNRRRGQLIERYLSDGMS